MQRSLEQLTFRERIRDCTHKTRELIEQMDQSLMPRLNELLSKSKPKHEDDVTDVTIRGLVSSALESQRYAAQIEEQIDAYSQSINGELDRILNRPSI